MKKPIPPLICTKCDKEIIEGQFIGRTGLQGEFVIHNDCANLTPVGQQIATLQQQLAEAKLAFDDALQVAINAHNIEPTQARQERNNYLVHLKHFRELQPDDAMCVQEAWDTLTSLNDELTVERDTLRARVEELEKLVESIKETSCHECNTCYTIDEFVTKRALEEK